MNNVFKLNELDKNTVQIYGRVKGIAQKRTDCGEFNGSYIFNISYIKDGKLYKVTSNEKDGTMRNLQKLENRIMKAYEEV